MYSHALSLPSERPSMTPASKHDTVHLIHRLMRLCTLQASITCIVVSAPVTGRVAQVSLERTLGTVAGGLLGEACQS